MSTRGEFLNWLVEQRSANQALSLRIYNLATDNKETIAENRALQTKLQVLIAINFSLWRAVFLAEKEELASGWEHAINFLEDLVSHNTISYVNDRNAKRWAVTYYTSTAKLHLGMFKGDPEFPDIEIPHSTSDAQSNWIAVHRVTSRVVDIFEQQIVAAS